ncbi:hypothetical protein [Leptotrichia trevisanii]|uniref:Uncharacterized protein n=1 Tax=Leptotrichia trevisanii TaxID=109328 RepID=A0A510JYH6_9FUSO|nr:hypothetical protein [Leptotrichia trevisanii]BBM44422.1 hypothetical protein JMUB3870_0529 [Leptotrichia trevisanii]
MKKFILLGIMILSFIIQAESLGKGDVYCLGIGKSTKTKDGIKFKAKLCRIGSDKLRNVTVYHNSHLIWDKYDVNKKLIYASSGSEGIFYNSDTGILNIEIIDPISRMAADTGSIFSVTDREMREVWQSRIVKNDLIEVYGNTLGIPTVSEKEYEREYDYGDY